MSEVDPRRPRYHLTPERGWLNDPYGVTYVDGRYLLFCQYDPDRVTWTPGLYWGVAESADLVHWSPLRTALRPSGPAYGCWSGAAVVEGGEPVLLYTRIDTTPGRHDLGEVVLAHRRGGEWVSEPDPVLVAPPDVDVLQLRDPHVLPTADGWFMVLGAGLPPDIAAVLGYRSTDLRSWEFTGVLCARPRSAPGPEATGSVWECPQLFELDGRWVLVVSVSHDRPEHVLAAVGGFDGTVFTPTGPWHRLLYGDAPYAATAFLDAEGRRCVVSWLREPTPAVGGWSGAQSLPGVLERVGDRVVVRPHPVVATLRGGESGRLGPHADLLVRAGPGDWELMLGTLTVGRDAARDELRLHAPGRPEQRMPCGDGPVRIVLDASTAEVFTAAAAGGLRIDPVPAGPLLAPPGLRVESYPLTG